jgi:hypothetical protein
VDAASGGYRLNTNTHLLNNGTLAMPGTVLESKYTRLRAPDVELRGRGWCDVSLSSYSDPGRFFVITDSCAAAHGAREDGIHVGAAQLRNGV